MLVLIWIFTNCSLFIIFKVHYTAACGLRAKILLLPKFFSFFSNTRTAHQHRIILIQIYAIINIIIKYYMLYLKIKASQYILCIWTTTIIISLQTLSTEPYREIVASISHLLTLLYMITLVSNIHLRSESNGNSQL